jgi:hypothetical protein
MISDKEKLNLIQKNYKDLVLKYNILDKNYKELCKEALEQPAWRPISLDEMQELHDEFGVRANVIFAIEDMLKEKNHGQ